MKICFKKDLIDCTFLTVLINNFSRIIVLQKMSNEFVLTEKTQQTGCTAKTLFDTTVQSFDLFKQINRLDLVEDNQYFKFCKFSPDGTRLLTTDSTNCIKIQRGFDKKLTIPTQTPQAYPENHLSSIQIPDQILYTDWYPMFDENSPITRW